MKKAIAGVWLMFAMVACGSSSEPGGASSSGASSSGTPAGCTDIAGNYDVSATKVGGDCPSAPEPKITITISVKDDVPSIFIPGIEGGCPGTLDPETCHFQAECKIFPVGDPANPMATFNVTYTFSGATFSGSMAGAVSPPASEVACTSTVKHEGTKL